MCVAAHSVHLQTQAEQCLNDDELRLLGSLLQEHATVVCLPAADGGADAEELRINYDGFNSVSGPLHLLVGLRQGAGMPPLLSGVGSHTVLYCWVWLCRASACAHATACCGGDHHTLHLHQGLPVCCPLKQLLRAALGRLLCCLTGRQKGPGTPRHQHSCGDAFHAARAVPAL